MKENLIDIYKVFTTSENLLRLLYYQPTNASDDPLSVSKTNILDMSNKWDIIQDRVKTTLKVDDLDATQICRLLFYAGRRKPSNDNYLVSTQSIVCDVLCHFTYDEVDLRLAWICDIINELLYDKRITGIRKIRYMDGISISAPKGYVGFRLMYDIGSGN
jgi:hypothetical protein